MSEKAPFFAHLHPLDSLTCELQLMLDHLFLERSAPATWEPVCDLYQTSEAIVVTVELPGLTRDDVEITVTPNLLTVTGRRPGASLPPRSNVHQHERRFGPFERRLVLPTPVDADASSARMTDGVLTITLPHRKPTQVAIGMDSAQSEGTKRPERSETQPQMDASQTQEQQTPAQQEPDTAEATAT